MGEVRGQGSEVRTYKGKVFVEAAGGGWEQQRAPQSGAMTTERVAEHVAGKCGDGLHVGRDYTATP